MALKNKTHDNEKVSLVQRAPQQQAAHASNEHERSLNPASALKRAISAPPAALRLADILALQRTVGNRAVHRLLAEQTQRSRASEPQSRQPIQAKLTIGAANDKYEQEADRVARHVMSMDARPASPSIQRGSEKEEDDLQRKPSIVPITPLVQREVTPEDEEQHVSSVQRHAASEPTTAGVNIENAIKSARGSGQALPHDVRARMESAIGADFSGVKVHTDDRADKLSHSLQARAFTTGQALFFKRGEYNPGSSAGRELIAHELTHVLQQSSAAQRQGNKGRLARAYPAITVAKAERGEGEQVNRKIIKNPKEYYPANLDAKPSSDDLSVKFIEPYYTGDKTLTTVEDSVKKEAELALYAVKPNQGKEHAMEQWINQLYKARKSVEELREQTKKDDKKDTDSKGAVEKFTELYDKTNLILDNGQVMGDWRWKVTAAFHPKPITVQDGGKTVAALVRIEDEKGGKKPTPKKLQLSVDRHMWSLLSRDSVTKQQNSMLVSTVKIDQVRKDMEAIAQVYLKQMSGGHTKDIEVKASQKRTYFVERLTGDEPHVYPVDGAEVVPLNETEHMIFKKFRGVKEDDDKGWADFVGEVNEKSEPGKIYELMTKLGIKEPPGKISKLKKEVENKKKQEDDEKKPKADEKESTGSKKKKKKGK